MMLSSSSLRVALVGRRLADNDNLGLGYLQAALDREGIPCQRHVLNHLGDVQPIARAILRDSVSVVGLSLSDGGSAPLALALGEMLHAQGFDGHITCGGPFATLARDWLLERYEWIDSVVRHEGERVLPSLCRFVIAE
jgi:radical SAM superfamily enzyme YgiQ (UPF0313 family)